MAARRESGRALQARAARLLDRLRGVEPEATTALQHGSALELLVATILSAQCTDARVNQVTPELFQRWPTPHALAKADPLELEGVIRSTGFFRNKAKSLLGMAQRVVTAYGGEVPQAMDDLVSLPGVARKTANVVRGEIYVHPSMTRDLLDMKEPATPPRHRGGPEHLTSRELDVVRLLATGHTNRQIAEQLSLSVRTVESHRARIMGKLGLSSRADLVRWAAEKNRAS